MNLLLLNPFATKHGIHCYYVYPLYVHNPALHCTIRGYFYIKFTAYSSTSDRQPSTAIANQSLGNSVSTYLNHNDATTCTL